MKNWRHYKKKTYTQNEARKMDYELDLIHLAIAELYNGNDDNVEIIKKSLDEIKRKVHSKPDVDTRA